MVSRLNSSLHRYDADHNDQSSSTSTFTENIQKKNAQKSTDRSLRPHQYSHPRLLFDRFKILLWRVWSWLNHLEYLSEIHIYWPPSCSHTRNRTVLWLINILFSVMRNPWRREEPLQKNTVTAVHGNNRWPSAKLNTNMSSICCSALDFWPPRAEFSQVPTCESTSHSWKVSCIL